MYTEFKTTKPCSTCGDDRRYSRTKNSGACVTCHRAALKLSNKKTYVDRRNNLETKLQDRFFGARARAKRNKMEFTITQQDLVYNTFCPILGIKLNYFNGKQLDDSPSIDRIDSTKGYIPGNVHVISWRANNLKADGKLEEFEQLINWMKNNAN